MGFKELDFVSLLSPCLLAAPAPSFGQSPVLLCNKAICTTSNVHLSMLHSLQVNPDNTLAKLWYSNPVDTKMLIAGPRPLNSSLLCLPPESLRTTPYLEPPKTE